MWVPRSELIKFDNGNRLTTQNMKKTAAKDNKKVTKGLYLNKKELIRWRKKFPPPD